MPRYATKADWAAARAAAIDAEIAELHDRMAETYLGPRRYAQMRETANSLIGERERFRALERRFKARGQ